MNDNDALVAGENMRERSCHDIDIKKKYIYQICCVDCESSEHILPLRVTLEDFNWFVSISELAR